MRRTSCSLSGPSSAWLPVTQARTWSVRTAQVSFEGARVKYMFYSSNVKLTGRLIQALQGA